MQPDCWALASHGGGPPKSILLFKKLHNSFLCINTPVQLLPGMCREVMSAQNWADSSGAAGAGLIAAVLIVLCCAVLWPQEEGMLPLPLSSSTCSYPTEVTDLSWWGSMLLSSRQTWGSPWCLLRCVGY